MLKYRVGGMVDKGFTDQLKGKTKEIVGDLTGDTVTKVEGWLEQGVGKTKKAIADVTDIIEEVSEKATEKLDKK